MLNITIGSIMNPHPITIAEGTTIQQVLDQNPNHFNHGGRGEIRLNGAIVDTAQYHEPVQDGDAVLWMTQAKGN